jgi:hypothetical protein
MEIRKLVTQSGTDFSRKRKLTPERIIGFIINMPKRSLSVLSYRNFLRYWARAKMQPPKAHLAGKEAISPFA